VLAMMMLAELLLPLLAALLLPLLAALLLVALGLAALLLAGLCYARDRKSAGMRVSCIRPKRISG